MAQTPKAPSQAPTDFQWALICKRLIDLLISVPLCILLLPLYLIIAVAIKADSPGPALFIQSRRGLKFEMFKVLKFRTLTHNAPDPHERYEVQKADPRITRVGAFLRRTSLDELPQLLNVVCGTMSLVGPRPLQEWESQASLKSHADRFLVKPGITGLSVLSGRNTLDFDARLDKDVEYVHRWSLWLDFQLLLQTPWYVLSGQDVYPQAEQGVANHNE